MIPFKMHEVPFNKWASINSDLAGIDLLQVFQSDRFLVQIHRHGPKIRMAINKVKYKAMDGKPIWADGITWDELQEIKNQCGFRDKWLCEYYPPEEDVVNVANIRHLWVLDASPEYSLERRPLKDEETMRIPSS